MHGVYNGESELVSIDLDIREAGKKPVIGGLVGMPGFLRPIWRADALLVAAMPVRCTAWPVLHIKAKKNDFFHSEMIGNIDCASAAVVVPGNGAPAGRDTAFLFSVLGKIDHAAPGIAGKARAAAHLQAGEALQLGFMIDEPVAVTEPESINPGAKHVGVVDADYALSVDRFQEARNGLILILSRLHSRGIGKARASADKERSF